MARRVVPLERKRIDTGNKARNPSMLYPKIQIFGHTGKLVIAEEDERREWAKLGVRKLMRGVHSTCSGDMYDVPGL